MSVSFDLGEIPDTPQEGVGYTRGSAAPECNLHRSAVLNFHPEQIAAPPDDADKVLCIIIFKGEVYSEPGPERSREQAFPRGRADQRERIQGDPDGTRPGSLVYKNVYGELLHGGIKILLHDRRKPVYLVYEEDITFFQ